MITPGESEILKDGWPTVEKKCANPKCSKLFKGPSPLGYCSEACEVAGKQAAADTAVRRIELDESWPDRHVQNLSKMQGPALSKARELLPRVMGDCLVILAGDRGRGKTAMMTWLAYRRGQSGSRPGRYAKAYEVFEAIKATFGEGGSSETKALDRYRKAPFLAIDEAHERSDSPWTNHTLRNIVDRRYDAMKPTVIAGNWLDAKAVTESLGASIVDRATETGGIVFCNWKSYRINN